MNIKRQKFTLTQLRRQLFHSRLLITALVFLLIVHAISDFSRQDKTIILPPERSKYVLEDFSADYIEGFIYHWTKNLFDYTPQTCQDRIQGLARFLAHPDLLLELEKENLLILEKSLHQSFFPKSISVTKTQANLKGFLQRESVDHSKMIKEVEITLNYHQGPLGAPLISNWNVTTLHREHL